MTRQLKVEINVSATLIKNIAKGVKHDTITTEDAIRALAASPHPLDDYLSKLYLPWEVSGDHELQDSERDETCQWSARQLTLASKAPELLLAVLASYKIACYRGDCLGTDPTKKLLEEILGAGTLEAICQEG
ncbi:MAG: hypothetical protein L3J47_00265 [Sulfurovum sp.]|nr:hypothetical protein [Sulfurovum sp.]